MRVFNYLRTKWGVGPVRFVMILLTFALAGATIVRVRKPVLSLILPADSPRWVFWVVYILVIVPIYQALLLAYGTLLGQFHFFWQKLMMLRRRISGSSRKS